jgi:hypothetical protein
VAGRLLHGFWDSVCRSPHKKVPSALVSHATSLPACQSGCTLAGSERRTFRATSTACLFWPVSWLLAPVTGHAVEGHRSCHIWWEIPEIPSPMRHAAASTSVHTTSPPQPVKSILQFLCLHVVYVRLAAICLHVLGS